MVVAALALAVVAVPANADTAGQLDDAKSSAEAARAELNRTISAWQAAEADLAQAEDDARSAQRRIEQLTEEMRSARVRLDRRAAALYMAGGDPTLVALLTSSSPSDVADRLQFADAVAQQDADLAVEVAVQTEELAWEQARLDAALETQRNVAASLESQQAQLGSQLATYEAKVAELEDQLAAEQAPPPDSGGGTTGGSGSTTTGGGGGSPPPVSGSGWLQTCPVAGPNSFVDSFGDPRPGGRSHAGIDMIAAAGTPVVATAPGRVHHTGSSIGGLGTVLFHDGSADWTFYTHFSGYAGPSEGGHVSAGETIGYVGNTGTTVYHLHFEYHPGGGAAVNPYSALLGAC